MSSVKPEEKQGLLGASKDPSSPIEWVKNYPCPACCCGCCLLYGLFMLFIIVIFALVPLPSTCAIKVFSPDKIGEEMLVGTSKNVLGEDWPKKTMDLTGLWWLRWNSADSTEIAFYNFMRLEIVVSFAGAEWDDWNDDTKRTDFTQPPDLFPFHLRTPGQQPFHWGYSDSIFSSGQMIGHAFSWPPDLKLTFDFENNTYAYIESIGEFIRLEKSPDGKYDEWWRTNYMRSQNYVLTRVTDEEGQGNIFWEPFQDFMAGYSIRTWGDNNVCKRKCESILSILYFPASTGCKICRVCG